MAAESKNMSPEVKHMLSVLRSVIRGLGYNYQDVANKLGLSNGYMSRLFSGKIELKFQHIVDISRVLGFEPEEIFHLAYPRQKEPTSPAAQGKGGRSAPGPTEAARRTAGWDRSRAAGRRLPRSAAVPRSPGPS